MPLAHFAGAPLKPNEFSAKTPAKARCGLSFPGQVGQFRSLGQRHLLEFLFFGHVMLGWPEVVCDHLQQVPTWGAKLGQVPAHVGQSMARCHRPPDHNSKNERKDLI